MWALAAEVGLDVNSPYAYALWGHHHRRSTLVAEQDREVVGFTLGYLVPDAAEDLFVWQIGVHPARRSAGIAGLMLDTLTERLRPAAVEATVTPSNRASDVLFRSFARRHSATVTTHPCFDSSHFPGAHEPEHLYRIDLRPSSGRTHGPTTRGETFLGAVRHPGV